MNSPRKNDTLDARLNEMEATCRLWIAVSTAKDERIQELEAELHALRQRVARLSRQACRRSQDGSVAARIRSAR